MTAARAFPLRAVLSVVLNRKLCPGHELYDLVEYMTGEQYRTYRDLVHGADDCRPHIIRQHPALAHVSARGTITPEAWERALHTFEDAFGPTLVVEPLPRAIATRTRHRSHAADGTHR